MTATTSPEALRVHLDEGSWAAALDAADRPDLPAWASAHLTEPVEGAGGPDGGSGGEDGPDDEVVEALRLRHRAVLAVDVATTSGRGGVLAELSTDLRAVTGVARRVLVGATPTATRALEGVEVSATTIDRLLPEVVRLLPPVPAPEPMAEAELPEELTVGLAAALRTGDRTTVDAVCEDQGWGAVPDVLVAVVQELLGTATVTVRRHGVGPVVGHWLLTRRGWVELVRTRDETVRHVPRSREDLARTILGALTAAAGAVLDERARSDG